MFFNENACAIKSMFFYNVWLFLLEHSLINENNKIPFIALLFYRNSLKAYRLLEIFTP